MFISNENQAWKRIACTLSFVVGVLVILFTGSRGGLIGFGVAISMLLFTKTKAVKTLTKVIFVCVCVIVIALNLSRIDVERYRTIGKIQEDYNLTDEFGRKALWSMGMKLMFTNPLTGVGVGCFPMAVGMDRAARGLPRQAWQQPHNMLVQIGSETGVIGFILFLLMSYNIMGIFGRGRKRTGQDDLLKICEMGRIGFMGSFISGMFLSHAYSLYWAFYVVMSAVINQLMAEEAPVKNVKPRVLHHFGKLSNPGFIKRSITRPL
jgi:O-antigen ligase